jgi:hypothetical protein
VTSALSLSSFNLVFEEVDLLDNFAFFG